MCGNVTTFYHLTHFITIKWIHYYNIFFSFVTLRNRNAIMKEYTSGVHFLTTVCFLFAIVWNVHKVCCTHKCCDIYPIQTYPLTNTHSQPTGGCVPLCISIWAGTRQHFYEVEVLPPQVGAIRIPPHIFTKSAYKRSDDGVPYPRTISCLWVCV